VKYISKPKHPDIPTFGQPEIQTDTHCLHTFLNGFSTFGSCCANQPQLKVRPVKLWIKRFYASIYVCVYMYAYSTHSGFNLLFL